MVDISIYTYSAKNLYHKQVSGRKLRVHARLEAFSFRNLWSTYVVYRSAGDIYIYFPQNMAQCWKGNG